MMKRLLETLLIAVLTTTATAQTAKDVVKDLGYPVDPNCSYGKWCESGEDMAILFAPTEHGYRDLLSTWVTVRTIMELEYGVGERNVIQIDKPSWINSIFDTERIHHAAQEGKASVVVSDRYPSVQLAIMADRKSYILMIANRTKTP